MNPHQKNKVDISKLTPDEQRLFRLYGKLPTKKDLLQNKLKERKYFDSGDYALSKAGKASDVGVTQIGSQHPSPENIPHLSSSQGSGNGHLVTSPGGINTGVAGERVGSVSLQAGKSSSPVKESSLLRGENLDDQDQDETIPESTPTSVPAQYKTKNGQSHDDSSAEGSISPVVHQEGIPIKWQ